MAYMLETVARVTGATIKQLIHWDRTGLVQPTIAQAHGKGSRRVYSFLDVLAIKTAVTLRREGISLQKVRRCLKYLREHQPEVAQPLAGLNLVTDGVTVFLLSHDPGRACQDRQVIDTLAGGQLLLMVPIGRIACEVQREVARLIPDFLPEIPSSAVIPAARKKTQRARPTLRKGVRAG
jgi:DNA-binding transcriptional MerR regulator